MKKKRVYKKGEPGSEYDRDQASSKSKGDRAERNKAHKEEDPPPGYEVDHKVPLSKGGSNGKSNRRVVKRSTNREKGAARSDELKKKLKLPRLR
tara:strand:- start:56 stop:337 length:282 start_codon:yes stop_codon:yes gene_type:complete